MTKKIKKTHEDEMQEGEAAGSPPEMIVEPNDPPPQAVESEIKKLLPPGASVRAKKIDDYFDVAVGLPLSRADEVEFMKKIKEVTIEETKYGFSRTGEGRYKLRK